MFLHANELIEHLRWFSANLFFIFRITFCDKQFTRLRHDLYRNSSLVLKTISGPTLNNNHGTSSLLFAEAE